MSDNSKYYLVEKFIEGPSYSNGTVVALTPEASFKLKKNNIPHRIINEFFSEKELKANITTHFYDQIEWFKQFDLFLKNNIDYCRSNDINLAMAHYNPLKYLIDSFITYSFILASFIKKARPSKIVFVTEDYGTVSSYSVYSVFRLEKSCYSQLLPLSCKKNNIPFEHLSCPDAAVNGRAGWKDRLKSKLKHFILRSGLKSLQSFKRYRKYSLLRCKKGRLSDLKILFMHTGTDAIDYIVQRVLSEGAQAYSMSENFIFRENKILQDMVVDFKEDNSLFTKDIQEDCRSAALKLREEIGLLSWIDDKCNIGISSLMLPYLEHFINFICIDNISRIDKISDFYEKENIDYIIMRSSTGLDSAFSLAAANKHKNLKKICFQHSCTAFEQLSLLMTDTYYFDYYATTDLISERYFNVKTDNKLFDRCKIIQSPHYLASLEKEGFKKRRLSKNKKEIVMYAPNDASKGIYNLNVPTYEPNWYCKFLKELVGYFGKYQDKMFIFKYRPGFNWTESVIVPYIKANTFKNIIIENKPFTSYLNYVDRVILDYPATALFESIAARRPTLALYGSDHILWDGARDFFKGILAPFINAEEAIGHIDDFLASPKEKYMLEPPLMQNDIIDLLNATRSFGKGNK